MTFRGDQIPDIVNMIISQFVTSSGLPPEPFSSMVRVSCDVLPDAEAQLPAAAVHAIMADVMRACHRVSVFIQKDELKKQITCAERKLADAATNGTAPEPKKKSRRKPTTQPEDDTTQRPTSHYCDCALCSYCFEPHCLCKHKGRCCGDTSE